MHRTAVLLAPAVLGLAVLVASDAAAGCPPDCAIPGGGDAATDCFLELAATGMHLNYPAFDPAASKPAKEVRCLDGDSGCDLDGQVNNQCVFDIDVCLRNADSNLPSCTPADVTAVTVGGATKSAELQSLQSAVNALLPATGNVCTGGQQLTVPLKGPDARGAFKRGKGSVKITSTAGASVDADAVKLSCLPRNWPAHGYDAKNTRATPLDTAIDAGNVGSLVLGWQFPVPEGSARGVTSTPTVDDKHVYVTSWNGRVYALKRKDGTPKWIYNTGSASQLGVQSSATLTADGRLLVGDSKAVVHCLSAKNGKVLWTKSIGDPVAEAAHIWASPTVVNDKVFVGKSSHSDQPCTRGELVALDLDTGAELWRTATVPEGVCHADTNIACANDDDCGDTGSPCVTGVCSNDIDKPCTLDADCPGVLGAQGFCITTPSCFYENDSACATNADCPSCIPALGGGVTATPAASVDGDTVYMASVGCFTSPSVGNSDSMFALDAETGAIDWVYRTESVEQFADGPPYHDYGFLNGPILADVDDGLGGTQHLVVGASKDGAIYAVDRATGAPVWMNQLAPAVDFAGFGLFNAPVAFADGTFYAALFQHDNWPSGNDHLYAFSGTDGGVVWQDQIGASWAASTVANGVLYTGTMGTKEFYAYDAATGARLRTFVLQPAGELPDNVSGGAAVVGDTLYVPYGVFGSKGGLLAFTLPR